ncbi:AAA family ATPase [Cyanobium sp. Lug-B]|nr:AAA family ATPase [Cyanobium sp. Lug-B]
MSEFSSDRPLSRKADDKLNRAPFAERVAAVLRGLPKGTGLVVGIHGPWGDGKTTVLNLLRAELESDSNIATVDFNPWRFTDEASMLAGFFRVLAGVVRAKLTTKVEDIASWIEKIGAYASVIDDRFGKAGEAAGAQAEASLEELRGRLSEALSNADTRLLVLVDDIDRLDKHETHTLFRLIKACADFPNVCYVLAFDDVAVAKSLGERYGGGDEAAGLAFLEKIIQVPLKLPAALKEDLRSLCFDQIDQAFNAAGIELTDEDIGGFVSGFDRGISMRLDTPRAAKRYGNGLMFALPMLKGEANIVDLLLIEAVRAFFPTIYDVIRDNYADFSGVDSEHLRHGQDRPRAASLLNPIVDKLTIDEQQGIKSLLKSLFPRLGREYGGGGYGPDCLSSWAKLKRICSPDYCPRYFTYSVPKSDVRDSEMNELYAKAAKQSAAEVEETIVVFFTSGKAKRVIERMRQHVDQMPSEAVASLCVAIAKNGYHIPNPPSLFTSAKPVSQAGILISHMISRLTAGEPRVMLAKEVVAAAEPVWFGHEVLRWLYVTDDADKADSNTLTKDEVNELAMLLVERIKARANSGQPLFSVDVPQEQSLLFEWWRVEGREPVQAHLSSVFTEDPTSIGLFLQAMAGQSWGLEDLLPRVGRLDANRLKSIKHIYDLDALAELIQAHLPGNFANPQYFSDGAESIEQQLAEQFMYVYNLWKKDGETPEADGGSDDSINDLASTDVDPN